MGNRNRTTTTKNRWQETKVDIHIAILTDIICFLYERLRYHKSESSFKQIVQSYLLHCHTLFRNCTVSKDLIEKRKMFVVALWPKHGFCGPYIIWLIGFNGLRSIECRKRKCDFLLKFYLREPLDYKIHVANFNGACNRRENISILSFHRDINRTDH